MEVFRISRERYSKKLTSLGSANRWNVKGQQVIYAGSSRSLASLELIVHKVVIIPSESYRVMVISIADDDYLLKQIQLKDLPSNWRPFAAYAELQKIRSTWINSLESLVL